MARQKSFAITSQNNYKNMNYFWWLGFETGASYIVHRYTLMVLTELWWFQKKIFYIRMCKFIELLFSRQFMTKATDCIHYSVNSPLLYLMLGRELTKYMSMQCIVVRKYCLLMHNTHLCISVWNYFRRSILFMTIHFYKKSFYS